MYTSIVKFQVINAIEHLRCGRQASIYTNNIVWSNIQTCVSLTPHFFTLAECIFALTCASLLVALIFELKITTPQKTSPLTTTCQVEFLLRDYMAVDEDVAAQTPSTAPVSYAPVRNDVSYFFARSGRRPDRAQPSLFSFESSATGDC